jgi:hypothetical protein
MVARALLVDCNSGFDSAPGAKAQFALTPLRPDLKEFAEKGRIESEDRTPQRLKPDIVTITYGRPEGRPLQRI